MKTLVEPGRIEVLRRRIARIELGTRDSAPVLPLGVAGIDRHLPGGGLACGALHEVSGGGADREEGAVPAAFIAGLCARIESGQTGAVVPVRRPAIFMGPGLAACGLAPERLMLARAAQRRRSAVGDGRGAAHPRARRGGGRDRRTARPGQPAPATRGRDLRRHRLRCCAGFGVPKRQCARAPTPR